MSVLILLVTSFLILVSPATSMVCDRCLQTSQAAFYGESQKAFSQGACGYGTHFNVNDHFAGATQSIFEKGVGCSRCYEVRCKDTRICSTQGTTVTVIDQIMNVQNEAFVMSVTAFKDMAKNGSFVSALKNKGIVDIEYKRVPCKYGKKNMTIWVEEFSNMYFLAIKILNNEGQTDIVEVKVAAKAETKKWVWMIRNFGAIWSTGNVPKGALKFQLVVTSGIGNNTYTADGKHGLPANWNKGKEYDLGLQLTNVVAKEKNCKKCDKGNWK